MIDLVFPAPPPSNAAVAGSTAAFPVGRVYCIGRNYQWNAGRGSARATCRPGS